jgi:hypothetical protein
MLEDSPKIDGIGAFWSTPSCVAVGCVPDCDGDTEITIGPAEVVGLETAPLFDSVLPTPSGRLIVETVMKETILQVSVQGAETRVRIWTDGHPASEFVVIGLD